MKFNQVLFKRENHSELFSVHILTSDTIVWVGIIKALRRGNHLTSFSFSAPVSRYQILISLKLFQSWSLRNRHIFSSNEL
jgi:hypothetical protein